MNHVTRSGTSDIFFFVLRHDCRKFGNHRKVRKVHHNVTSVRFSTIKFLFFSVNAGHIEGPE